MLTSVVFEICLGMDKLRNIILQGRNRSGFVDQLQMWLQPFDLLGRDRGQQAVAESIVIV